jgi:S-adenosylmethionine/arginine decarboxylase-like enzyme
LKEIVNKVAQSKLVTIDLEDYYPQGNRVVFDIKDWLYEEIILKEKDFRSFVKNHNWSQYKDSYVALTCSTDAIIPSWAYMLITTELAPFTKKIIIGNLKELETSIFQDIISQLSIDEYKDKLIIIKGCSEKPIPETAYTQLITKLIPTAKSIMYGEACSTVPLFKNK